MQGGSFSEAKLTVAELQRGLHPQNKETALLPSSGLANPGGGKSISTNTSAKEPDRHTQDQSPRINTSVQAEENPFSMDQQDPSHGEAISCGGERSSSTQSEASSYVAV